MRNRQMAVTEPKRALLALILMSLMAPATLVDAQESRAETQQGDTQLVTMRDFSDPTSAEDDGDDSQEDSSDLSLEELMSIKVVTASRCTQPIASVPYAISVITAEDIRQSGARCIAEALRLAPGVDVGEIAYGITAVSPRGLYGLLSNHALVLVDGAGLSFGNSAHLGREGLEFVHQALQANRLCATGSVDISIPSGWDGIEITVRIFGTVKNGPPRNAYHRSCVAP